MVKDIIEKFKELNEMFRKEAKNLVDTIDAYMSEDGELFYLSSFIEGNDNTGEELSPHLELRIVIEDLKLLEKYDFYVSSINPFVHLGKVDITLRNDEYGLIVSLDISMTKLKKKFEHRKLTENNREKLGKTIEYLDTIYALEMKKTNLEEEIKWR